VPDEYSYVSLADKHLDNASGWAENEFSALNKIRTALTGIGYALLAQREDSGRLAGVVHDLAERVDGLAVPAGRLTDAVQGVADQVQDLASPVDGAADRIDDLATSVAGIHADVHAVITDAADRPARWWQWRRRAAERAVADRAAAGEVTLTGGQAAEVRQALADALAWRQSYPSAAGCGCGDSMCAEKVRDMVVLGGYEQLLTVLGGGDAS